MADNPVQLNDLIEGLREVGSRLAEALRPVVEGFGGAVKAIQEFARKMKLLKDAGFLPHVTMPMHLIAECGDDPAKLSGSIENYYRENWPAIEAAMGSKLAAYHVDVEAKTVFREALQLHGLGFYQAVVRLLFPEIERVVRNDKLLSSYAAAKNISPVAALQQAAGELGLSEIEPGGFLSLEFFTRLTDHLYVRVEDSATVSRMKGDPIPNRHAAIHGRVIYRTFQNSLNTVFMADYIFQVVSAIRDRTSDFMSPNVGTIAK
jgi:hypothetical protein